MPAASPKAPPASHTNRCSSDDICCMGRRAYRAVERPGYVCGMRWCVVLAPLAACGQEGNVSSLEPEPSVLPAEVDFGEVVLGTTAGPTELHLSNAGPVDLHATVTVTGADAAAFTLTGGGSLVV